MRHRVDPDPSPTPLPDWARQYAIDYRNETKRIPYPLPEGERYPAHIPVDLSTLTGPPAEDEGGGFYATDYWQCAWVDRYLSAVDDGDAEQGAAALASLDRFADIPYVQKHYQGSSFADDVLAPAHRGDAGPMQDWAMTCRGILLFGE